MAESPITLAIEISNPSAATTGSGAGVAIGSGTGDGAKVLGVEWLREEGRHDDDLMPAIDRITSRLNLPPRDLTRLAVSVGPGGYTALRIAVATAKLIAEATGAACIAVPSANVAAARAPREGRPFAVALASKGTTTHVTIFSAAGEPSGPGRLLGPGDLAGLGVARLIADRFLPAQMREDAASLGIEVVPPVFDPAACFEASLRLAAVDPLDLLPMYAREPEAVTLWRQRKGG